MLLTAMATIAFTALCAAFWIFTYRRFGDPRFAGALVILLFLAYLAGSLVQPVKLTTKRTSLASQTAAGVDGADRSSVLLDAQSLNNLPNIGVPAQGKVTFVGVRRGARVLATQTASVGPGEYLELSGSIADPLARNPISSIFLIVNSSSRIVPRAKTAGATFVADIPSESLQLGTDRIEVAGVAADQRGFFKLPDRVTVIVTER